MIVKPVTDTANRKPLKNNIHEVQTNATMNDGIKDGQTVYKMFFVKDVEAAFSWLKFKLKVRSNPFRNNYTSWDEGYESGYNNGISKAKRFIDEAFEDVNKKWKEK